MWFLLFEWMSAPVYWVRFVFTEMIVFLCVKLKIFLSFSLCHHWNSDQKGSLLLELIEVSRPRKSIAKHFARVDFWDSYKRISSWIPSQCWRYAHPATMKSLVSLGLAMISSLETPYLDYPSIPWRRSSRELHWWGPSSWEGQPWRWTRIWFQSCLSTESSSICEICWGGRRVWRIWRIWRPWRLRWLWRRSLWWTLWPWIR